MISDTEFLARLQEEMSSWVREELVMPEVVQALRRHYGLVNPQQPDAGQWIRWVLYLAVFAFLAAFFSFAGSGVGFAGAITRSAVLLLSSLGALAAGAAVHRRQRAEGMALFILGGLLLPITFYFLVHQYGLLHLDAPYVWWSVLALAMAILYAAAARALKEEGLGGVALLSICAAAFLMARHGGLPRPWYPALTASLGLACLAVQSGLPPDWRPAFARAAWLLGQVLSMAALVLPFLLQCYGSYGAVAAYLLAAGYFFLQVRLFDAISSLAALTLSLMAAVGAFVRATGVQSDALPLIQLAFSTALIGAGVWLLRQRVEALRLLLATVLVLVLPGVLGLRFLPPDLFRARGLYTLSTCLYAAVGGMLYVLAWQRRAVRDLLSLLGTEHLFAALVLLLSGHPWLGIEVYTLPLGALLLLDLMFVGENNRAALLTVATGLLAGPSLVLSANDERSLRTVLLCLGGIGLVAVGGLRRYGTALILGIFVMLPAIFIKILPGLAELGIPRFVWFALFGVLLTGIAMVLKRKSRHGTANV